MELSNTVQYPENEVSAPQESLMTRTAWIHSIDTEIHPLSF